MPSLVLIWGQQCIKCASIEQFAISQKMHADERPKLHLAATRDFMWQPPDNHKPKKSVAGAKYISFTLLMGFRINDHENIKE